MENNFIVLKWVKQLGDHAFNAVDKLSKFLRTKYGKNIVKIVLQALILLTLIRIIELPVFIIAETGEAIITSFASTFRLLVSSVWVYMIYYAYYIFSLILIYTFIKDLLKDKDLIEVSDKKEKNDNFKNILEGIKQFFKILIYVSEIPIILIIIGGIVLLVYMSMIAAKGVYLISLFLFVISVIIYGLLAIDSINNHFRKKSQDTSMVRIVGTIIALLIFIASATYLVIETKNYSYKNQLTSDFAIMDSELSYSLASKEYDKIKIIAPRNIVIIKDENIADKIIININRAETATVSTKNKIVQDNLQIEIDYELDLKFNHFEKIGKLIMRCIEDKTIYDYNKLKYGEVQIRVNPLDAERLLIVDQSND